MLKRNLTKDYVCGLIEGEGSFMFSSKRGANKEKQKIPTFQLKMNSKNKDLVEGVRDFLGLKNKVYVYENKAKDKVIRDPYTLLIIRGVGDLKNIIVPFFYNSLAGCKEEEFIGWLERIGEDEAVPERYKIIHRLYKGGFYEKGL